MTVPQQLKFRLARLRVRWRRFSQSTWGQRVLIGLRRAVTFAVVGFLLYRMWLIGWEEVWSSLPRTPWFYIIFVGIYVTLPTFQTIIFSLVWGQSFWRLFPPMLKKRVYNKDVLSYSGEVYLYYWGRTFMPDRPASDVLHPIKDNAIVSSVASTVIALGLLGTFLLTGIVVLPDFIVRHGVAYTLGGVAVAAVVVFAAVRFRRTVLRLSGHLLGTVFILHVSRLLLVQALQIVQWKVVVPEIDYSVWFTFLAVQIVIASLPIIPSRDLLFVAAGIELASVMEVSRAAIAGLFVVQSMLDKGMNLILFTFVSAWDRKTIDDVSAFASEIGGKEIFIEDDAAGDVKNAPASPDPSSHPPRDIPSDESAEASAEPSTRTK
jgi:hypothetical protein